MKDIKEIYQALIDGETLVRKYGVKQDMVDISNTKKYCFGDPEDWEIYESPWKMKIAQFVIDDDGSIYKGSTAKITRVQNFGMKFHSKEQAQKANESVKNKVEDTKESMGNLSDLITKMIEDLNEALPI